MSYAVGVSPQPDWQITNDSSSATPVAGYERLLFMGAHNHEESLAIRDVIRRDISFEHRLLDASRRRRKLEAINTFLADGCSEWFVTPAERAARDAAAAQRALATRGLAAALIHRLVRPTQLLCHHTGSWATVALMPCGVMVDVDATRRTLESMRLPADTARIEFGFRRDPVEPLAPLPAHTLDQEAFRRYNDAALDSLKAALSDEV